DGGGRGWEGAAAVEGGGGEAVEQLRMAGLPAHGAEVVRGLDDPLAEVVLPEAVGQDAWRQGIATRVDQPVGQLQATAAGGGRGHRLAAEDLEEPAGGELAEGLLAGPGMGPLVPPRGLRDRPGGPRVRGRPPAWAGSG